ncbi:ABC transporter substrate-binding protein [Streptomyces alfalfae]|uniref:ABC transporter substrate-binding protein n=1 Tax=Streptomyces alfalfae TaxID=1642299 RepID=A0A1P8TM20_9ACTN|nr:ABC transporter substrate-binding protein [Streptomyces alfalfae]AYA19071.1 ABC transporter substrate-binding protein [Streptomyces fradiae]APY88655.1 ABC transporter substrate-binding protein [Streptomyces alfalfae]QQC88950.1 ABC transporter substrate-binding protein [Streptomyces alfalfae]QUI31407.1 ABC transporter substrate-binding protein [Streptomyces alfalfae]RXX35894.1 ABC transporter substrate-binding protein [Streptomyces alfalfae]
MSSTARIRTFALCCAGVLALTACGGPAEEGTAGTAKNGYPVTVASCGEKTEVEAPPRRAVSLDQGSTEILLSLGLADRMVGTGTWTDPVLKHLAKDNAKVERLADRYPAMEKVLSKEPDFVSASFLYTVGKGGVADRAKFTDLGVPVYVSPSDCAGKDNDAGGDGKRVKTLTMDTVYAEVRDLAKVFGVEKRGEKLIAGLKARVTKATEDIDASDTSLLYWFANSDAPYMAGCCGAPGIITRELDAENVFDDTREEWPQINWETVADRDPDVLVIGDLTRKSQSAESAAAKIRFLESNPATRNLTAVKKKRYVLLSGQAMNPTIRTVDGIEQVAAGLRKFGLAK